MVAGLVFKTLKKSNADFNATSQKRLRCEAVFFALK
jgi:hypothetical protein